MKDLAKTLIILIPLIAACGGTGTGNYPSDVPTNSPPIVSRVSPASGPVGTEITIYGFGFSEINASNIVMIGNGSITATTYGLVPVPTSTEIEFLTATVSSGSAAGVNSVAVEVYNEVSNTDITFTVTP